MLNQLMHLTNIPDYVTIAELRAMLPPDAKINDRRNYTQIPRAMLRIGYVEHMSDTRDGLHVVNGQRVKVYRRDPEEAASVLAKIDAMRRPSTSERVDAKLNRHAVAATRCSRRARSNPQRRITQLAYA